MLRAWAAKLFTDAGGKAINPPIGKVTLNLQAVRDSSGHGMFPAKAKAFVAVPQVIEQGTVISSALHDGIESHYISAPVRIGGVDDVG